MLPNSENSLPRSSAVLSTGDEFRTYIDPTDPGSYIVLRNTSVTLNCSASGDGVFSYSWFKVVDNVLQALPMENTSLYRVPPLQSDEIYECSTWNPLITTREQRSKASFSLRVVGKLWHYDSSRLNKKTLDLRSFFSIYHRFFPLPKQWWRKQGTRSSRRLVP